jgi:hypothetical protein
MLRWPSAPEVNSGASSMSAPCAFSGAEPRPKNAPMALGARSQFGRLAFRSGQSSAALVGATAAGGKRARWRCRPRVLRRPSRVIGASRATGRHGCGGTGGRMAARDATDGGAAAWRCGAPRRDRTRERHRPRAPEPPELVGSSNVSSGEQRRCGGRRRARRRVRSRRGAYHRKSSAPRRSRHERPCTRHRPASHDYRSPAPRRTHARPPQDPPTSPPVPFFAHLASSESADDSFAREAPTVDCASDEWTVVKGR